MVALAKKTLARKRAKKLCATPRCRRHAAPGRSLCHTCRSRKYDPPLKRLFWNLKAHAKRRGKAFSLTWELFERLALAGGYADAHGRNAEGLAVYRIDPARGYEAGNIQFLTNRENSRKRWVDYYQRAEARVWVPEVDLP